MSSPFVFLCLGHTSQSTSIWFHRVVFPYIIVSLFSACYFCIWAGHPLEVALSPLKMSNPLCPLYLQQFFLNFYHNITLCNTMLSSFLQIGHRLAQKQQHQKSLHVRFPPVWLRNPSDIRPTICPSLDPLPILPCAPECIKRPVCSLGMSWCNYIMLFLNFRDMFFWVRFAALSHNSHLQTSCN